MDHVRRITSGDTVRSRRSVASRASATRWRPVAAIACLLTVSGCGSADDPQVLPSPTPAAAETQVCGGTGPALEIVVEPALAGAIRTSLQTFEQDLCAAGYQVGEAVRTFATPPDLRAYLSRRHQERGGRLEGAFLVGDHPRAYQWVTLHSANPSIPSSSEEAISYQYYADLDGSFAASSGYRSPSGKPYSYDVHEGEVDWEIWIAVLPRYKGDIGETTQALQRYFAKNHAYRRGSTTFPRALLQVSEHFTATTQRQHDTVLASLRDGTYSWTPWSSAPTARLYFDSPPGGLSVDQGYADLSAGVADFTVQDAHGSWQASGKLSISWVETRPVRTAFFWSNGCAVADLDRSSNVLTSILYSTTSTVVAAKGTTNNSGGLGNNRNGFFGHNIAVAMSRGDGLGRALVEHVDTPLVYPYSEDREFHFGTVVLLGDASLALRP